MVLVRPAGQQHAREPEARRDVHEVEAAARLRGRGRAGGFGPGPGEGQRAGHAEEKNRAYLAGAMCFAQAASTFFHSLSSASAFGSRASMASAREEPRKACLAALVTTTYPSS